MSSRFSISPAPPPGPAASPVPDAAGDRPPDSTRFPDTWWVRYEELIQCRQHETLDEAGLRELLACSEALEAERVERLPALIQEATAHGQSLAAYLRLAGLQPRLVS